MAPNRWLDCVSAAGVHVRAPGAGLTGRTDSSQWRQQGHQFQPSQTTHSLLYHVVTRRSTWAQWPTEGGYTKRRTFVQIRARFHRALVEVSQRFQWCIQGGGAIVRPLLPLSSDHELLDNFCISFVTFVSRLNSKIRVPRLLVTVRVFCQLKATSKRIILGQEYFSEEGAQPPPPSPPPRRYGASPAPYWNPKYATGSFSSAQRKTQLNSTAIFSCLTQILCDIPRLIYVFLCIMYYLQYWIG